jgi:hypothetical protein
MIWLTWRQFRAQAVVAAAVLALLAIILAITGPQLVHLYDTNVATCQSHGDCAAARSLVTSHDHFLQQIIGYILLAIPGIIGAFWGAPLISRELEAGTYRLVWNQSVTRTRWLVIKLLVIGLASMAAAGLLSLIVSWWFSPIDHVTMNRILPGTFDQRGIVPIAYAAFAFALGVTAGVLIRRAVPAIAITLAIFAAVQVIMPNWVRPNLIPPVHSTVALTAATLSNSSVFLPVQDTSGPVTVTVTLTGAWVLSEGQAVNSSGKVAEDVGAICSAAIKTEGNLDGCVASQHLSTPVTYQPVSRFWSLQWYESGIYLGLAIVLAGFCFWWTRRRLT